MNNRFTFIFSFLLLLFANFCAAAQSDSPRVEVGGHYTFLRLAKFDSNENGIGGRVTVNLGDFLAIEGEGNFFPENNSYEGQKAQGLVGLRAGIKSSKYGAFVRVLPGVMRFAGFSDVAAAPGLPPGILINTRGRNYFTTNFGAGVQVSPGEKFFFRVDAGDTVIRYRFAIASTPKGIATITPGWGHNLQMSVAAGIRF